jgi:hypothetical protein
MLQSCSSSDDSSQSSSSVLLKKAIWNDGSVYDYLYQGNKITKIQGNDGSYSNFTYTGDFITKVESVDQNNSFSGRDEFFYSGNSLIQIKEFEGNVLKRKIDFVNNNDNTKTRTHTIYNGTNTTTVVYKEYYLDDEKIKEEKLNLNGSVIFTTTFLYDNKNYILKNVTGYNYIVRWYDDGGPIHNITKKVEFSSNYNSTTNYLYEYNSNGYPTSVIAQYQGSTPDDIAEFYY